MLASPLEITIRGKQGDDPRSACAEISAGFVGMPAPDGLVISVGRPAPAPGRPLQTSGPRIGPRPGSVRPTPSAIRLNPAVILLKFRVKGGI